MIKCRREPPSGTERLLLASSTRRGDQRRSRRVSACPSGNPHGSVSHVDGLLPTCSPILGLMEDFMTRSTLIPRRSSRYSSSSMNPSREEPHRSPPGYPRHSSRSPHPGRRSRRLLSPSLRTSPQAPPDGFSRWFRSPQGSAWASSNAGLNSQEVFFCEASPFKPECSQKILTRVIPNRIFQNSNSTPFSSPSQSLRR